MNIKKVHVYPNVTWSTLIKNHKYDIAILELEKEVQLTAKVKSFFHLTTPSLTSGASNMSPRQQLQGDCSGISPFPGQTDLCWRKSGDRRLGRSAPGEGPRL